MRVAGPLKHAQAINDTKYWMTPSLDVVMPSRTQTYLMITAITNGWHGMSLHHIYGIFAYKPIV